MKEELEYNYFELCQLQDSCKKILGGGLNNTESNNPILPVLEFKLSILHKMALKNIKPYEESRLKILKRYVNLNEDGNLKKKKINKDEIEKNDLTFYDILDWKDEDSRLLAENDVKEVLNQKTKIHTPINIKINEFVDINKDPIALNGVGYALSDFIIFKD